MLASKALDHAKQQSLLGRGSIRHPSQPILIRSLTHIGCNATRTHTIISMPYTLHRAASLVITQTTPPPSQHASPTSQQHMRLKRAQIATSTIHGCRLPQFLVSWPQHSRPVHFIWIKQAISSGNCTASTHMICEPYTKMCCNCPPSPAFKTQQPAHDAQTTPASAQLPAY